MKNVGASQAALFAVLRRFVRAPRGLACSGEGLLTPASHAACQRAIDRAFARHRTVGGTVTLVRAGQPLATFAYGKRRLHPDTPATEDTLYRVASVSKLVCAFPVMTLAGQGILSLDGDISDWLGYTVRNPSHPATPITPRQLMTHTAGLLDAPQYDGPGIAGKLTLREMLTGDGARLNFAPTAPGTHFRYSNFGAGTMGSVIEAVTGQPFDEAVRQTLFAPLGITASFAPQTLGDQKTRLSSGYAVRPLRAPRLQYDAPVIAAQTAPVCDPERNFMAAPGRLNIAVPDAATLLRLLLSDGAVDGVRILSPGSIAEMLAMQDGHGSVTRAGRGLGVAFAPRVFGRRLCVGHQGVAYGMNAELWADPDTGDGVAVATSGTSLRALGKLVLSGWEMTTLGFAMLDQLRK